MTTLTRRAASSALLARVLETPDLLRVVPALPRQRFAALVREIGVEDAGPIVALATTEQLVAAFDEDLFVGEGAGERETFDADRFVTWLEVLLEAGDEAVARRFAELSEDFVAHAIASVALVFDHEQLRDRFAADDPGAERADKALESAWTEEIDGYLLVGRSERGWDAVLTLILALDRDDRSKLCRILDRCVAASEPYVEDLDALSDVLSAAESLAEDAEAEREERRAALGFVEPRAARGFLALARAPLEGPAADAPRDPVTRAFFRDAPRGSDPERGRAGASSLVGALAALPGTSESGAPPRVVDGLRALARDAPRRLAERLEELAYLANVLLAGATRDGRRLEPAEAARAAIATVALGAELEARRAGSGGKPTAEVLLAVLDACPADVLFRLGYATALARGWTDDPQGLVRSSEALDAALARLDADDRAAPAPPGGRPRRATAGAGR